MKVFFQNIVHLNCNLNELNKYYEPNLLKIIELLLIQ